MTAINKAEGRLQLAYNDVDIAPIDTIGRCNQNSHFDELEAGDDMVKARETA
jgi:hypothetical protein